MHLMHDLCDSDNCTAGTIRISYDNMMVYVEYYCEMCSQMGWFGKYILRANGAKRFAVSGVSPGRGY
jgi:hypothetical protein